MSYPLFHPACSRAPAQDLSAEQFAEDFPAESERIEFKESVPVRARPGGDRDRGGCRPDRA